MAGKVRGTVTKGEISTVSTPPDLSDVETVMKIEGALAVPPDRRTPEQKKILKDNGYAVDADN